MKIRYLLVFLLIVCFNDLSFGQANLSQFTLTAKQGQLVFLSPGLSGDTKIKINQEEQELHFEKGQAIMDFSSDEKGRLILFETNDQTHKLYHISKKEDHYRIRHIPLWLSIIPPLLAIALALLFREVVLSLFIGVWSGAFIAGGLRIDSFYYLIISFLATIEKYILNALNDSGHLSVIIFSLLIGGMVAVISRNGGMAGVVQSLSRYAKSPKSAQFITWLLGVAIFFDDYANTLIVGNTMRSVTDRFKISREKLAYIVDSTAAPVAAVAFITTWIGAELGYIDDGIRMLDNFTVQMTPYSLFLSSLKYSFYPILTLCFILFIVFTNRDFGPMLKAEKRARNTGQVAPDAISDKAKSTEETLVPVKGAPHKWYNAVIPVLVVINMTLFGLVDTGFSAIYSELAEKGVAPLSQSWGAVWGAMDSLFTGESLGFFRKIGILIGSADSYVALLWASLSGVTLAIIMTLAAKIMTLAGSINSLVQGFKTMLPALIILTLAWSLAATTEDLHTATFLSAALKDSLNPYLMPGVIFILAAFISFSTGSSWSTMAILYPIAIPTSWAISQTQGLDPHTSLELLLNVIAVVLAASVLGDHCSPISDTTILSSLASDCNHIDHVRTQLPYALIVGAVSLIGGVLSTLLGGTWLISTVILLIGMAVLFFIVMTFGKKVD